MTNAWNVYATFSSEDERLRLSLLALKEDPESFYLDIRRMFEMNGKFLYTRRGLRVPISTTRLVEIQEVLTTVAQGKASNKEGGGLQFLRRRNNLRLRKKTLTAGEDPIFVILSPSETLFLHSALPIIREAVETVNNVKEGDEEEEEEKEEELKDLLQK